MIAQLRVALATLVIGLAVTTPATSEPTVVPAPTASPFAVPTDPPPAPEMTATASDANAAPSATPSATPTPTATPTLNPHPARYRGEIVPSQPASTSTAPASADTTAEPTIAQTLDDPTVRATIAHPIPELQQIAWLVGSWRAHSDELRGGWSRDRGVTTYVFAPTMKGRWLFGADGKNRNYFFLTYDPFSRMWVMMRIDGNPSYGLWTSELGWQENRIEFDSPASIANGRMYHRRTTIIHKDARTFDIEDAEQRPDGSWTPDARVELTKHV